jgi:hypothetical protein
VGARLLSRATPAAVVRVDSAGRVGKSQRLPRSRAILPRPEQVPDDRGEGPGRPVARNQRRFLEFCVSHDMPVSVCYVRRPGLLPSAAST